MTDACTEQPGRTPIRPWPGRAILHVDLDAFFAAVEQLDDPALRGKPVIVGGDPAGRGVVATASYEARAFGVRSAMPAARAARLCPSAVWVRPRLHRYREVARAVLAILESESPLVEPVSIDEAYLDVTPGARSGEHPVLVATRIRERIARLGITASAGLATSRTVAKIASDHHKPNGLTVVWPGEERSFLAPLPIDVLPGIGPRSAHRLRRLGICRLVDLASLDPSTARDLLGSAGPVLAERACGFDPRPISPPRPARSISCERTFATDLRQRPEVDAALERLVARVCERLSHAGVAGRTVTLKVRYADLSTRTAARTLPEATDEPATIRRTVAGLLPKLWTPGVGVRLLGVGVSAFVERSRQLPLADEAAGSLDRRIVESIERIRARYGSDAVVLGSELPKAHREPYGNT